MRILVSGSSGLIGRALLQSLSDEGHDTVRLVRRPPGAGEVGWHAGYGVEAAELEGVEAVVHLAGEPISSHRWNSARKRKIRDSRVHGTRNLSHALSMMRPPPSVMVSASAIGWYGDRGDEELTESSARGAGFLSDLCADWEAATEPAESAGVRVVHLRSGIVLSARGGALGFQLPVFKLGLGGRIGSGRQFISWITLEDEVGAILHCLFHAEVAGPVNSTAPAPVTNADFTDQLAKVLGRPAKLAVPAWLVSVALGAEMAQETVLQSARVLPARLEESGYAFRQRELEDGLRAALSS